MGIFERIEKLNKILNSPSLGPLRDVAKKYLEEQACQPDPELEQCYGRCPVCKGNSLEYFEVEIDPLNKISIPFHCLAEDCSAYGSECYRIIYRGSSKDSSEEFYRVEKVYDSFQTCPRCQSYDLDYEDFGFINDDFGGYPFTCSKCEQEGLELYSTIYIGSELSTEEE